jgi:4-hydroxy-tetrahydrodipicolinate synthase
VYRGLIVPMVTPVDATGEVLETDIARLVETLRPHVAALLPGLSTGEGWALSDAQWRDLVACTVRCAGGLPVLAGVQCATREDVLRRVTMAAELGASGVVVSKPHGKDVSGQEVFEHYRSVLAVTTLPLTVYNESAVSGNETDLATLLRICALPGVHAVKESSGDAEFTRSLVAARPGVAVWQGWEHLVGLSGAVDGAVLALGNLEPELCATAVRLLSLRAQEDLTRVTGEYGLLEQDWYARVKSVLYQRKVLTSGATIASGVPA